MELTKERPILMNTESVVGILDDRKTQTRRVPKQQPPEEATFFDYKTDLGYTTSRSHLWAGFYMGPDVGGPVYYKCPFGKIGDRLWVKETYCLGNITEADSIDGHSEGCYVSQCPDENDIIMKEYCIRHGITTDDVIWKPSIFMFRKYSRILLEITHLRIEQIQDISEEDAIAEGIERENTRIGLNYKLYGPLEKLDQWTKDPRWSFETLWNSINAKPKPVMSGEKIVSYISYPWDDIRETREHRGLKWIVCGNPQTWAVTFKVLKKEV